MIYIFGAAFDPPHAGHGAITRALLHYRNPEKIVLIPSGRRNDKEYKVSNEHRKELCQIFVEEIRDARVIADYYFLDTFTGEMITQDVDIYAREKYGEDIIHIFGTDTIGSMPEWDVEQYAAKVVKKLFMPRGDISSFSLFLEREPFPGRNKSSLRRDEKTEQIQNYELFTDSHFPDISSTQIRANMREEYMKHTLHTEDFTFSGLSKRISQYILGNHLYWQLPKKKERILIHVCCGPDVTMPILELKNEYDIICFWYDPNIEPKAEYDKRFLAFKRVCEIENIPFIKGIYDVKNFHKRIAGLEHTPEKGEKCTRCYDMRLRVTARLAKKLGINTFTTSLNTSPKKDLKKIFTLGDIYAEEFGLTFLSIPFRKNGGFDRSVKYTREHDIYRQNYCGCIYSIREGGGKG